MHILNIFNFHSLCKLKIVIIRIDFMINMAGCGRDCFWDNFFNDQNCDFMFFVKGTYDRATGNFFEEKVDLIEVLS